MLAKYSRIEGFKVIYQSLVFKDTLSLWYKDLKYLVNTFCVNTHLCDSLAWLCYEI